MGKVYLAHDSELERDVAIKVLQGDADESPDRVRRFLQEARSASALNHPNVAHVYEIGSVDGLRFIAMEVVPGETLRQRIRRGEIEIDEVLSIGTQIASALAAAHAVGIIHRDIKPENVIIRPDGYVKVLDFGLAKKQRLQSQDGPTEVRTASGVVVGTLQYMAPEQLAGGQVTAASDVFSLGVVLYEMVGGRRPFEGDTPTQVATAILTASPPPLPELRVATPPRLASVITKALSKTSADRHPSAVEVLEELKQITRESATGSLPTVSITQQSQTSPQRSWKLMVMAGVAIAVLAAILIGVWQLRRSQRIAAATATLARAERLAGEFHFAEAYDLAAALTPVIPQNEKLTALIVKTSREVAFESEPAGATVSVERFGGPPGRVTLGTTPLTVPHLALADYIVTFEKSGFATAERSLPLAPRVLDTGYAMSLETTPRVQVRLVDSKKSPAGMVLVPGGPYRLAGFSRLTDRQVDLKDFFIDRFEVTNRQFSEFVRAGGYRRRELWDQPMLRDGKPVAFEEAMAQFHDTTGLPGPRGWNGGAPPAGKEEHPVTGVTWYEAAAFAKWRGASLPTVFQWERAARTLTATALGSAMPWGVVMEGVDATERANYRGRGTMPVGSLPFGLSPWGALDMAGNASEWCRNPIDPGFAVRGGSWNDAVYSFGTTAALPGFFSSDTVGFRCARPAGDAGDEGAFVLAASTEVPVYHPVDDRAFAEIQHRYDYAKTPLEARVVETVEQPDWRREKIEYRVGTAMVPAYLYLPRGVTTPLQVICFSPAGDVDSGHRPLPESIESGLAPYIRGGRAVFSVVLEGFVGRPMKSVATIPDWSTAEFADYTIARVTEMRRGLDYLETRKDIDASRIAFMGPSAGSATGLILAGVEHRYRSVLFVGTRISPNEVTDTPAANRINFAPRISGPKMMLQGRYDESAPLVTRAEPLFHLLVEPKRLEVYEGSHVPPQEVAVPIITKWLDETLGKVAAQ